MIRQHTADTEYRSGVPQARHLHGLLVRGARILEELFPGIRTELAEMGAPIFDFGESAVMFPTGWAPRGTIGLPIQTFTGTETTASLLSWAWHLIGTHPDIQRRLRTETDNVLDG